MNAPFPETRLYRALGERLAAAIASGAFRAGDRLPSVRELAVSEGVSIATAVAAYRHLEDLRIAEARPKSGFFVSARKAVLEEPRLPSRRRSPTAVGISALVMGILDAARDPRMVPLAAACPGPELFPSAKLQRMLSASARAQPDLLTRYRMSLGHDELRHQIARRSIDFGCALDPEDIIVTDGCMEALTLCLRAVARTGDTIALESPTYFSVLLVLESLGLKALELPTNPRTGVSLDALELATRKPGAVSACLFTTNFSNPLGSLMPETQKRRMVELLAKRGIPLIDDDIYGDLYFGDRRPRAAKAWDRSGNVLLCSSFTKTVAPGLRVGWVAPGRFRDQVALLKFTNTVSTAEINQAVIARFLASGGYDHHMRRLRHAFAFQVQRMSAAIEASFPPDCKVTRPSGGFVLWVELPPQVDALALFWKALDAGISVAPGPMFSASGGFPHHIRISCGGVWTETLERAVHRLGALVRELAQR